MADLRSAMKNALPTTDDLFKTQAERDDEKLATVREISISEIDDSPDLPYRIEIDENMMHLVDDIRRYGVVTPAIVRKKDDGRYELISGHRRRIACELAGLDTLSCVVLAINRDDALKYVAGKAVSNDGRPERSHAEFTPYDR